MARWKMGKRMSILKSKKGAIPVVSEILQTFLAITPPPILFLIFLFLIGIIGGIVTPSVLNLFGYECVQNGNNLELYQVPISKMFEKSQIDVASQFGSVLGLSRYQLPDDPFPNGNKEFLRVPAECFDSVVNGSQVQYGYSAVCVDCPLISNFFGGAVLVPFRGSNAICVGDGYYAPTAYNQWDLGIKSFCNKCSPPDPYYFNITNCASNSSCYFTITDKTLITSINTQDYTNDYYFQQIIKLGGIKKPQDSTDLVNVQCEDVSKPQLYFFTIKIFDLQLWIWLTIAYILIMFASFYYQHIGLH